MSLLNITGRAKSPLMQLVSEIHTSLKEQGSSMASAADTNSVLGLESLNSSELESLNQTAQRIGDDLRASFESISEASGSLTSEALTATQLEAATMAALAAGDPEAYAQRALSSRASGSSDMPVISAESAGAYGSLDYREDFAMESFDRGDLDAMMPYSIAFNLQATRQDEFSETFYPTTVVSPELGGLDMSIDQLTVFNSVKHTSDGKAADFKQQNLLSAVADATILADESTKLVPFVAADGSNADRFVSSTAVAPHNTIVSGVEVRTAPLAINQKIDLLGVSHHPQLQGAGVLNETDQIGGGISLGQLFVQFPWGAGANTGTEVISFDVSRLPRSAFVASTEGQDREMVLNFSSDSILVSGGTKAVDGTASKALAAAAAANYEIRLSLSVNGTTHLHFGNVQLTGAPVGVTEILDAAGEPISTATGGGAAIAAALEQATIIGYVLDARRTNSNRRTRGLLLNNVRRTERYSISLGAPISAPSPTSANRDARDLEALVTAAKVRNSNNAVTTLLNYADTLRAYVSTRASRQGATSIEGIARHVVVPSFEETTIELPTAINSIRSKDRADDISAHLVNAIRDIAYRLYTKSSYQTALDASEMGINKVTLVIGTDSEIIRHLIVEGDTRTFGAVFSDYKVVKTFDTRMRGKIVIGFTRNTQGGEADPLNFGTHAWIPELASTMTVNRDGATIKEAMVQPRSRHINNLPIMGLINVNGLADVVSTKIAP